MGITVRDIRLAHDSGWASVVIRAKADGERKDRGPQAVRVVRQTKKTRLATFCLVVVTGGNDAIRNGGN
jgi:hypothetical protein